MPGDLTSLGRAAAAGDVEAVAAALAAGADPNARDDRGALPLALAVKWNHLHTARLLLEAGADPNAIGRISPERSPRVVYTDEPILYGALRSPDLVQLLLESGADPNRRDERRTGGDAPRSHPPYSAPLLEAVRHRSAEVVAMLLEAGADPAVTSGEADEFTGESAIFLAIEQEVPEVLPALLAGGCDPNAPRADGLLPLVLAAQRGSLDVVEMLLDAGVDPSCAQHGSHGRGWTPLHAAAFNGHVEVIRLLLARGADPGAETTDSVGFWDPKAGSFEAPAGAVAEELAALRGHVEVLALLAG